MSPEVQTTPSLSACVIMRMCLCWAGLNLKLAKRSSSVRRRLLDIGSPLGNDLTELKAQYNMPWWQMVAMIYLVHSHSGKLQHCRLHT